MKYATTTTLLVVLLTLDAGNAVYYRCCSVCLPVAQLLIYVFVIVWVKMVDSGVKSLTVIARIIQFAQLHQPYIRYGNVAATQLQCVC